jgi:hypothetical protein
MRLDAVGRVTNPDELDFEPIVVPVIAYDEDHNEVEFEVKFRAVQPTGAAMKVMRATDAEGNIPTATALLFLEECVIVSERKAWQEFLDDPGLYIERSTLVQLYERLTEVYAGRPTRRRSASSGGRRASATTSPAAAPSTASTSSPSPSSEA